MDLGLIYEVRFAPAPEDKQDVTIDMTLTAQGCPAHVQISDQVVNVGDQNGTATVGVEVDNQFVTNWVSDPLDPGQSQTLFVSLGRFEAGSHEILVFVNPGSGQRDHETNTINLP